MPLWRVVAVAAIALGGLSGVALAKKAAAGQPSFKPTDPEAYFVWHDASGWHLRVSTGPGKKSHQFHGVIRGEGITAVKGTKKSLDPAITSSATVIRFEFDTVDGGVGFDWKTGDPCTTYELKVDGKALDDRVHVGSKGESPSGMPFDACE